MGVSVTPRLSLRTPASPSPPFREPLSEPFDERHCASCLSQPADPHISLLAFSPVHRFPLRHLVHTFYGGRPIVLTSRAQVPVPPVVVSPPFRAPRLLAHSSGFVVSIGPPALLEFPSCVSRPCPPSIIRLCVSFSVHVFGPVSRIAFIS